MYQQYKSDTDCSRDTKMDMITLLETTLIKESSSSNEQSRQLLSGQDVTELLRSDPEIDDLEVRPSIIGYPSRPLYREIGSILQTWSESGKCPIGNLPNCNLLDERDYTRNRDAMITEVSPHLDKLKTLWSDWSQAEREERLQIILQILGKRGLLDLLGIRKTAGSNELWPPPRKVLENTFKQKHKPDRSLLTVGARALAKHAHRDESASWWGVCKGTETAKNQHAKDILYRILDHATWLNIHELPHNVPVIEARQAEGYGVRWSADGLQFRGFLEPQMEDGHEVGWRH